jgi:RNA polymerase sigma-70 factor, ECF subfamily
MEDWIAPIEATAQAAWQRRDYDGTVRIIFHGYGSELYSFLVAQFRGQVAQAEDVFADFAEDLWRSLPTFQWRCSVRAWCYKLVRSAASRYRRSLPNRNDRRVSLGSSSFLEELVVQARTATQPHLRSEVKDEFQRLREKLSEEDQDLLILRVDRNLSWREVAHAMQPSDDAADELQIRRAEAALRQRFSEVKRRLRALAKEAGLL